jgi:hypothetical protein
LGGYAGVLARGVNNWSGARAWNVTLLRAFFSLLEYQESGMAMSFSNVLRGHLTVRSWVTLLERGGYRVTPLGIEELFDEVKFLPLSQYLALGLPPALRSLPDLLVTNSNVSWARLIEVKFRQRFDQEVAEELYSALTEQRKYWPDLYAIIMIGEPFVKEGKFHQDFVRVVPPSDTEKLRYNPPEGTYENERKRMEKVWDQLLTITKLFSSPPTCSAQEEKMRSNEFWTNADYITRAIKELGRIA